METRHLAAKLRSFEAGVVSFVFAGIFV
jgi:hypothetical protein